MLSSATAPLASGPGATALRDRAARPPIEHLNWVAIVGGDGLPPDADPESPDARRILLGAQGERGQYTGTASRPFWWGRRGSNWRPSDYETEFAPVALRRRVP